MSEEQEFLSKLYEIDTVEDTRRHYNEWAASYDAEITKNGYATPARCAAALAEFALDKSAPILDIGCGTGISGLALRSVGFTHIDGSDLSDEMLNVARAKESVYHELWKTDLDDPFPFETGTYTNFSAMGVISSGHAEAPIIDAILAVMPVGGLFVFSLSDHALEDPTFEARVAENIDTGAAQLLFKEHGDHLPGIGMGTNVYVLRKK